MSNDPKLYTRNFIINNNVCVIVIIVVYFIFLYKRTAHQPTVKDIP